MSFFIILFVSGKSTSGLLFYPSEVIASSVVVAVATLST